MYAGVAALLLAMWVQLAFSVHGESLSWDEGDHLFAAYMTAKHGDYGLNPEHPPLVKLVAALPLLAMPDLREPQLQGRNFKVEAFLSGKDFNAWNIDRGILFRARLAVTIFPLMLALLVFLAAREMFGTKAAFVALTLLAFDPTLLAHGAMVTTDVGVSCFIFATVYAFYRYAKSPSWGRAALVGLATGLGFAAKHTGVLVVPMLIALAIVEIIRNPRRASGESTDCRKTLTGKMLGALTLAAVISLAVLWAFYGFRYNSRPAPLEINPPLSVYVAQISKPWEATLLSTVARFRALPESYLYGMADIQQVDDAYTAYFFGKTYPHGTHWYFPGVIVIKSTLPFLILMLIAAGAILSGIFRPWREILFLTIPPAIYLTVAMSSQMNIGARHIMPVYPFLYVLGAGAVCELMRREPRWGLVITVLLLWQVVTTVRVAPVYMAYGNEAWGGPNSVHKYLSDSNTDWAQQLIATKKYLDDHHIKDCWFLYFAQGVTDPASYGIPCKLLPTTETLWWLNIPLDVPPSVDGINFGQRRRSERIRIRPSSAESLRGLQTGETRRHHSTWHRRIPGPLRNSAGRRAKPRAKIRQFPGREKSHGRLGRSAASRRSSAGFRLHQRRPRRRALRPGPPRRSPRPLRKSPAHRPDRATRFSSWPSCRHAEKTRRETVAMRCRMNLPS